jgi:hypothetical protein
MDKMLAEERARVALAKAEVQVTEASASKAQSEKELEAKKIADATEKERLRAKAKTTEVATALAPFLGSGYWQPGHAQKGVDAGPVSLSAIKAAGALTQTRQGVRELYNLGANPHNDRSAGWPPADRLVGKPLDQWYKNKDSARDTAKKAQDLLLELGDTLVELGLLAP